MMMKKKDKSDMNERAARAICTRDACVVAPKALASANGIRCGLSAPIKKQEIPSGKNKHNALSALVSLMGVCVTWRWAHG
jgi:hypothetical protein